MPISSTDPFFKLIYGCDESLATANRVNSGSLGSAQDLSVYQSTGSDGVLSVADGNGGHAAWFDVTYPSPYSGMSSAARALRAAVAATGSVHTARAAFPLTVATDDFAFGARFKWVAGETDGGGAAEGQFIFGLATSTGSLFGWSMMILPNTNANPASGGKIRLNFGGSGNFDITGASFTETGSPPSDYILPDEWYRATVRFYYGGAGTGYRIKLYVYRESTATLYTFDYNSVLLTYDYSASFDSSTSARVMVGYDGGGGSNPVSLYGYVDDCWLYDAPLSDGDATTVTSSGISIPWSEPSYAIYDHDPRVTLCREGGSFAKSRQVGVGVLRSRIPVQVRHRRLRVRYESYRPGRPWALRRAQVILDSSGPRKGREDFDDGFIKFDRGWVRQAGVLPANCLIDGRNIDLSTDSVRSRRGFRIRRDVATVDSANAFFGYRDLSDQLFRLYKVGSSLYAETGTSSVSIDSGYSGTHLPSVGILFGRAVILTPSRQKTHRSSLSAVESFGIAAPAAPTAALAAGTLTGTFYYLYTEYDPTTGDESAPGVLVTAISPAAQGVTLTLAAVSSDTRFSQRRIYRSTSGGAATTATLIATIATATSHTDSGASTGVTAIEQVGGVYITGTPPDTFAGVTIHRERCFYYKGATYSNRLYWTEAGKIQRFYANAYIEAEGPIRCVVSQGQRLIIFTDYTVEILESDFVRDSVLGTYSLQRTVVSRTVGCFGHKSAINAHGRVFWIDSRGAWTLDGDTPVPISEQIKGVFPFINTNLKHRIVAAYNHVRRQVWFCVALGGSEFQTDTSRVQTVLVYQIDKNVWCPPYHLEACFADQFDDDNNGLRFGIMDQIGCFKEMETYEGDGIEGDETHTFEGTVSTIASRVLTPSVAPTAWTTDLLRGMGITLVDSVTGAMFYTLIASNTSGTLTLLEDPGAGYGSPDTFYVGGFPSWAEPAEQDGGSQNEKVARFINSEMDKLSTSRIY